LESQIRKKDCELLRLFDIRLERDEEISKLKRENAQLIRDKNITEVEKELDLLKYDLFEMKKSFKTLENKLERFSG
jgi:hypothetical protein